MSATIRMNDVRKIDIVVAPIFISILHTFQPFGFDFSLWICYCRKYKTRLAVSQIKAD